MRGRAGTQGLRWLTPDWPAPATVRALSTLRTGGASGPPYASLNLGSHVGDDATAVAENRRALRDAARLPAEPVWLEQVHGICIKDLDSAAPASGPADAAVTGLPGRVCAILTADCLPVLLASDAGDRVGAAHAGWRGLAAGVIEATVAALGAPPGQLMAWLGPAIGPRHFEVGAEVREEFLRRARGGNEVQGDTAAGAATADVTGAADAAKADAAAAADAAAFVPNARGRYMADLYALARRRLQALGVERIYGGGECTYADEARYFSHRRDGKTGRQATLIWLTAPPRR
ncbi:MAG TPA: peptidoglycan editing factor PgeF [Steroidobacteraceae bacterium]|nr:peptidoglycan editing factor PgeF [Steroidobacteraceae bacterium]